MKGTPITVRCDCGTRRLVRYGDRWSCEQCGRRWDTSQIPAGEYWGVMKEMRQFRLTAMAWAAALGGLIVVAGVVYSLSIFLLLPLAATAWYFLYMPRWRRRLRTRTRSLPSWELHPE